MLKRIKTAAITLALLSMIQPAAAATSCQSVSIPSYFSPKDSPHWASIVNSVSARARVQTMTITPCDKGPITPCLKPNGKVDPAYVQAIRTAKNYGVTILGYVWTNRGGRSLKSVQLEIDLYKKRYQVDGIFLDGVATDPSEASYAYYKALSFYIKGARGGFVALNPGAFPTNEAFMRIGDLIITWEGAYEDYVNKWSPPPAWAANYPAGLFGHLVHTTPADALGSALQLSQARNAGTVYVTDARGVAVTDNPWNRLPVFWEDELLNLSAGCR